MRVGSISNLMVVSTTTWNSISAPEGGVRIPKKGVRGIFEEIKLKIKSIKKLSCVYKKMNRSNRNMKMQKGPSEINVPDIKDFNTFEELSCRVMYDVDIISEIIGKYDRRTTDHIMALTYSLYKERIMDDLKSPRGHSNL